MQGNIKKFDFLITYPAKKSKRQKLSAKAMTANVWHPFSWLAVLLSPKRLLLLAGTWYRQQCRAVYFNILLASCIGSSSSASNVTLKRWQLLFIFFRIFLYFSAQVNNLFCFMFLLKF